MADMTKRLFGRSIATAIAVAAMALGPAAQEKKTNEKTNVTGTWDVNLMSHQFALVLEQEGSKVTGTMMMMGKDIEMEGEFVDGTISLVGKGASFVRRDDPHAAPVAIRLTGVLKEDGTMEGEAPGMHGDAATWTAERLKKKK
jgi:hypothetical protein